MKGSLPVAVVLLTSAAFLTSLVPGGPIEDRDFSHIHGLILIGFNLFLTLLVLASLILGVRWIRSSTSALWPLLLGVGYLAVYLLDLLKLFPVSPSPMNQALWTIEMAGLVLSIVLMVLSLLWAINHPEPNAWDSYVPHWPWLLCIGGLVVAYATYSAAGI